MSEDRSDDRIEKLSERFKKRAVGRKKSDRNRERHSFYLDSEVVERVDEKHRELNHKLYPAEVSKAAFLEAVIQYSLENLEDIKQLLSQPPEDSQSSEE